MLSADICNAEPIYLRCSSQSVTEALCWLPQGGEEEPREGLGHRRPADLQPVPVPGTNVRWTWISASLLLQAFRDGFIHCAFCLTQAGPVTARRPWRDMGVQQHSPCDLPAIAAVRSPWSPSNTASSVRSMLPDARDTQRDESQHCCMRCAGSQMAT